MKLRFIARLVTWFDPSWDRYSDQIEIDLDQFHISFLLKARERSGDFLIIPVAIDIPNVQICRNERGIIDQYRDEESLNKAYMVASYLADVLQLQTGFCQLRDKPEPDQYIPDNQEEKQKLKNSYKVRKISLNIACDVHGCPDLSPQAISRYWRHRELLNIKAHAERLNDPISKYTEWFRALEYCQAAIKKQARQGQPRKKQRSSINDFDRYVAQLTIRNPKEINHLRYLRHQCAHAYEDFVTHGDLGKLQEIEQALPQLHSVVDEIEKKLLKLVKLP